MHTMSGSFVLCLFSALLAVGSSLVCETCASHDPTSCSGPLKTCKHPDNICLSNAIEYKIGDQIFARSFKECASSSYGTCKTEPFTMSFGLNVSIRTYFCCCKSSKCNTAPIKLPPVPEELNGLECPSCYNLGNSPCSKMDILKCRGNEDHCIEISGTMIVDKTNITKSGAGCASAGACSIKLGVTTYSKNAMVITNKFVCYPAPKAA